MRRTPTPAGTRALQIDGLTELDGRVTIPNQNVDAEALHVSNSNAGANARALKVDGRAEITRTVADETALLVTNTSDDAEARALKVQGKAEIVRSAADETALLITNTSVDSEARALKVVGMAEIAANDGVTKALMVTGSDDAGSYALIVEGLTEMNGPLSVLRNVQDVPALYAENTDANTSSRSIKAQGTVETIANDAVGTKALIVNNPNGNASSRAIHVTSGVSQFDATVLAGSSTTDGKIDGNNSHKLQLGTQNSTTDVDINRAGQTTTVKGALTVDQAATLTGAVVASSTVKVTGALTVGPNNAAGRIDAVPTVPGVANNLEVGGQNSTNNVRLGRAGQTIDMFGQTRLNGNGMVVNGAAAVNTVGSGAGFIYNGVGHGGGASIDFYIAGVMVRYVDATGWN